MIRRFNYTGRQLVNRAHARIIIDENPLRLQAILKLDDYGLPSDARVFVEAYRQTTWMRFDFGTLQNLRAPEDCALAAFETPEGMLFRVKVTASAGAAGRLLAEADQIPSVSRADETPEPRQPLLPVKPHDLGREIFRIDYSSGPPILLVNKDVGDCKALAHSAPFICLIYPQVLREILTRILRIEGRYEFESEADWQAQWLQFASQIPGGSEPPALPADDETLDDWIDEVVGAFGRMHNITDRFRAFLNEDAGS